MKKPYSDKRWTQPLGGKVVGKFEITTAEKEESDKFLADYIKNYEEKLKHHA